jgi:hypothetical protein
VTDKPHIPTQFVSPDDPPRETFGPRASFPPQHDRPDECAPGPAPHPYLHRTGNVCQTCGLPPGAAVHDPRNEGAPERDAEAVAATPAAAAPNPEAPEGPKRLAAGTYAVYDDNAGGVVLVIRTDEGENHHKHIPAKIIKMGEMMMGGNNPLAAMFGG